MIWDVVGNFFKGAERQFTMIWDVVGNFFKGAERQFTMIWDAVGNFFKGTEWAFTMIWDAVGNFFKGTERQFTLLRQLSFQEAILILLVIQIFWSKWIVHRVLWCFYLEDILDKM